MATPLKDTTLAQNLVTVRDALNQQIEIDKEGKRLATITLIHIVVSAIFAGICLILGQLPLALLCLGYGVGAGGIGLGFILQDYINTADVNRSIVAMLNYDCGLVKLTS